MSEAAVVKMPSRAMMPFGTTSSEQRGLHYNDHHHHMPNTRSHSPSNGNQRARSRSRSTRHNNRRGTDTISSATDYVSEALSSHHNKNDLHFQPSSNQYDKENVRGSENMDYKVQRNDKLSQQKQHQTVKEIRQARGSKAKVDTKELEPEMITIEEIRRSSDGTQTVHKYLRGKLLGKGGFAKVYWCTSLDTQKPYAIKIVPKANLVKSRARQKLQAEIKIHRTLKHKNVCDFKHFFEDRTNCYILLELCTSQTLNELIKRRKRLTEPEVIYFMLQIIEGVRYMHSNNVIHRDLKLGNLFLDKELGVKIGDFGLATKLAHRDDKRSTICGTPNYIAPEVIDGNKNSNGHSFEVDIWAMGVIMYATLVGKPPYEAKDVKSTYQRIINNEYSFPSNIPVSDNAKHLITGMLQTRPCDRPTLNEVASHPYLTQLGNKIPRSLPVMCTHAAPTWREDEFGILVAEIEQKVEQRKANNFPTHRNKKAHSAGVENHQRRPLTARDNNQVISHNPINTKPGVDKRGKGFKSQNVPTTNQLTKNIGVEGRERNLKSGTTKPTKFQIYNENSEKERGREMRDEPEPRDPRQSRDVRPQPQSRRRSLSKDRRMEELSLKTNALNLGPPSDNVVDEPEKLKGLKDTEQIIGDGVESAVTGSAADRDMNMLESMHTLLTQSFCRSDNQKEKAAEAACPGDNMNEVVEAKKWVTRYVDYTSKYGLGFLLNDGSAGVYFNDSTKAVLAPRGDKFQYVERRKTQTTSDGQHQRRDPPYQSYSLTSYPESLQKKVTLLKHFRNYLQEQQQKAEEEGGETCEMDMKNDTGANVDAEDNEMVYLKKWVRTRHAILFRLSNRTVQVVFYDHSEVLLSCEARVVTYVDKSQKRSVHPINDITKDTNSEIAKRLKYAMDILHQLISGAKH